MDIQIYRCQSVLLLVPDLFLPAHAAQKLYGPCHRIATIRLAHLQQLVSVDALDAVLSAGFAAIPLDEGNALLVGRTAGDRQPEAVASQVAAGV